MRWRGLGAQPRFQRAFLVRPTRGKSMDERALPGPSCVDRPHVLKFCWIAGRPNGGGRPTLSTLDSTLTLGGTHGIPMHVCMHQGVTRPKVGAFCGDIRGEENRIRKLGVPRCVG